MTAESLVPLDVPEPSMGAPLPRLVANDHRMLFAYFAERAAAEHVDAIAVVRPKHFVIHKFGAPNEDSIMGSRLFEAGLQAVFDAGASAAEVVNSQWIAELERMGHSRPSLRHFVFAFHDSMLEFVADGMEVEIIQGALQDIVHDLLDEL